MPLIEFIAMFVNGLKIILEQDYLQFILLFHRYFLDCCELRSNGFAVSDLNLAFDLKVIIG